MKRSLIITALAAIIAVIASYAPARATPTTVVVRPANLVAYTDATGWYFWNDANDTPTGSPGQLVSGPATPPLGTGSVELGPLTTASGATGSSTIATNAYYGTPLANITSLSYSSYQPGPTLAVSFQFDVRYRPSDGAVYGGRLVFEPYQNGTVTVGSGWQTWSPLSGKWWATKTNSAGTGGTQVVPLPTGNCAISTPCTWSQILAAFPNAQVYGRVLLKSGSNWSGFDGNADALTIGVSGDETTYDFDVPTPCSTDCYVRPDGNDLNGGGADTPGEAKKTIQAGVNHVLAGGTVHVAAGTYTEQVSIGKNLTLTGAGAGSTIINSPASLATLFTTSDVNKPVVFAHDTTNVAVTGVTVDGLGQANANYRMEGIAFHNAGGSVSNSSITGIRETPFSGNQQGVALYALNDDAVARTLSVTNNTISDYQKNGMALNGDGLTSTVSGNSVTGAGATPLTAQNGIQIGFGAGGSITGNTVSGNFCTVISDCTADPTSATNADGAAGILLYTPGASNITVSNNVLTDNQFGLWAVGAPSVDITDNTISATGGNGIAIWDCDQWCSSGDDKGTTGTIDGNTISGQVYGILERDFVAGAPVPAMVAHNNSITSTTTDGAWSNVALDATNNWWGSANGPVNPANTFNVGSQGVAVSANIAFVPWLDAAPPTGVSFAPVTTTSPVGDYSSIQAGINGSNPGGTVNAKAGTFTENVVVSKSLTVAGAGAANTSVIPALSSPNSCGGSLCPSASNVFLVQANDVTIHDLTADGDNPALTSGIVAGGADLDARNGIITNHNAGVYNNLVVHHVTVKNIYLRGIYASSGGTFNFHDNMVQNVQADPASIAMFNFGGSGTFANNTVSDASDAISANHSRGTQFLNNTITDSASGVHTDNAGDGGGAPDLIQGNSVSNGTVGSYGIWVFVPYTAPTFTQNTVSNVDVGIAAFGSANPVTSIFNNNDLDGASRPGSVGAYITTDQLGYDAADVSVLLTNNSIQHFTEGVHAEATTITLPAPHPGTTTITAKQNAIANNGSGVVTSGPGNLSLNMTPNWWGDESGPNNATTNPAGVGNSVADGVVFSPWIGIGTDASVSTGFQLTSPMTWVAGPAVCGATCIQAAIDDAANGDTVKAKSGVFNEHVNVNKQITLTAGSMPIIDGGGSGDGITISVPNVTVSSFEVRNVTNGIVIASGSNNATVSTNNIHNFTSAGIRGTGATGANINGNTVNGGHTASCIGGFWGIVIANVSGTIGGNAVAGIGNGLTTGCQEGRAIEADGAATVNIANNNVSQYQKSGIIIRDSVNSIITGNTTAGEGATAAIAQNGITITSTGTSTITGNHTSGNRYTPEPDFSCGILYFPVGNPPAAAVTVNNNDSTDDEVGICLTSGSATNPVTGVVAKNNVITHHRQQGIYVDTMMNALIDNNQIDGQAGGTTANGGTTPDDDTRYYGVFAVDSAGTISNNVIKGITHGVANGIQSGVGIRITARAGDAANMTISGNNISDVQKNAMVITNVYGGTGVNAVISGNTVAGNGPVSYIAQNGIQVSNAATAQIDGNNVSGYDYTPSTVSAVGILVYQAGTTSVTNNIVHDNMEGLFVQQSDNAVVTGNTFSNTRDTAIFAYLSNSGTYTANHVASGSVGMYLYDSATNNVIKSNAFVNNDYGVYVDFTAAAPTGTQINLNCIAGNTMAGVATTGTVGTPVDATQNWWGAGDGANPPGHGDVIDPPASIDASAHLTVPTAGCVAPFDTDDDGCGDAFESHLTPPTDPYNPWDFYSVPVPALYAAANPLIVFRDNAVTAGDAQAVFAYFKKNAHTGTLEYEQDLNANGKKDGIEYDRSIIGPGLSGPPDGSVSAREAQVAFAQFQENYHC